MATVGRGADQYTVRFPDGLREQVKSAAEVSGRSMNAEIVARLEASFASGYSDVAQVAESERIIGQHTALLESMKREIARLSEISRAAIVSPHLASLFRILAQLEDENPSRSEEILAIKNSFSGLNRQQTDEKCRAVLTEIFDVEKLRAAVQSQSGDDDDVSVKTLMHFIR